MRIRSIRPEFWRSDDVAALTIPDRLLFIGLWSYVDDNGVGLDKLAAIASDLFADDLARDPRETLARVSDGLATLSDRGMIARYEVAGKAYFHVTAWRTHQRIDKPGKARYPLPTCDDAAPRETLRRVSRESPETLAPGEGEKGRRGEGEKAPAKRATQLPASWEPTPEHVERARASGVDITREVVKFRQHAEDKGRTSKSWNAAFTTWLMNAAEWARPSAQRPAQAPVASSWGRGVPTDPYGLGEDRAA